MLRSSILYAAKAYYDIKGNTSKEPVLMSNKEVQNPAVGTQEEGPVHGNISTQVGASSFITRERYEVSKENNKEKEKYFFATQLHYPH